MLCYRSLSLYSTATQNYWHWGQRKFSRWGAHPRRKFLLAIPACWYLKTLKFALAQTRNIQFVLPPMQNPNASQWNIGCVPTQNFRVGHVHFILFVSISFVLGSQRERSFQQNMGFSPWSQKHPSSSPFMYPSCRHAHSRRRGFNI